MRVYQFREAKIALKILREKRLKLSTLDELNDPFEFIGYASKDPHKRAAILKTKEQMTPHCGLICFSEGWRNPVQWSHYADRHKGICLGFDVTPINIIDPVDYTPTRPKFLHEGAEPPSEHLIRKMLTTKFSHWQYEEELRFITTLADKHFQDGMYLMDFESTFALKEVIIGANSTVTSAEVRSAIGGDSHPKIITARLSFQEFRVVTQQRKDLQK